MKKVVVGMSGGVDSAVTALLLKNQGYDVVGLFMHNWEEEEDGVCSSVDDWEDARAVADKIGIKIYSVNFAKEYLDRVFSYFLKEYSAGRTPNPDVLCNREIKFDAFVSYAKNFNADYIATGHYCNIDHSCPGYAQLLKAKDQTKDQTYFLNQVKNGYLENVIFPLGNLTKKEIRSIAEENKLFSVAKKKDSTGICFIGERNFRKFLKTYLPAKKGLIVDKNNNVVGEHDGIMYYTLGQRKGLNIGGKKGYEEKRWYIIDKDVKNNKLVVSCGEEEELFSTEVFTSNINFIGNEIKEDVFDCYAKVRYRQPDQKCKMIKKENGYSFVFENKQRADTPGQFIVIYDEKRCYGGGIIESFS